MKRSSLMDNLFAIHYDTREIVPVSVTIRVKGNIVCEDAEDYRGDYNEWALKEKDIDKGNGSVFSTRRLAILELQGRALFDQLEAQKAERVAFQRWVRLECDLIKEELKD